MNESELIIATNGYEPDDESGHTPIPLILVAGIGCLGGLLVFCVRKDS